MDNLTDQLLDYALGFALCVSFLGLIVMLWVWHS